jgi:hypothetical protein
LKHFCSIAFVLLVSTIGCFGQPGTGVQAPPVKSEDELKQLLTEAYNRNSLSSITTPYHLVASFETFAIDGQPAGNGSIERFFISPLRQKTITSFRNHKMTEYIINGKRTYTDDGFDGTIMVFRVGEFLFSPMPPPMGFIHRKLGYRSVQLRNLSMDCAMFQFFMDAPGRPKPPAEGFCISGGSHDLVLKQTEGLSVQFRDFAPFQDKMIPHTISITSSHLRGRIHVEKLDSFDDGSVDLAPPADASPDSPGPNWISTSAEEDERLHKVQAQYPPEMAPSHTPGYVSIQILISRTGAVKDAEPWPAQNPALVQAALDAAKQWTFAPIIRQGKPIETITSVGIDFK